MSFGIWLVVVNMYANWFNDMELAFKALGSYDRASWAKYEERKPTRCNN